MDSRPAPLTGLFVALGAVALAAFATLAHRAHAASRYSDAELRAVETSDEAKIRELRDQEVNQIRLTIGRHLPANRRVDLYHRVAELDLEAYHAYYLLEGRVHDKRIEQGRPEGGIDHAHSAPYLRAGIRACEDLLKLRLPYSKMDDIYYFLAFNYGEQGDRKRSERNYLQLVKNYPSSAYAGEAYRSLGDDAFADHDFRRAQVYYEKALKRSEGADSARVLHKLAWALYRTKQYRRAVDTMKQAIDVAAKNGEKFLSLKEEALRDMALFMTETGRVDEAIRYFADVAGDKAFYPKVLERFGKQFEHSGETAKAVTVYDSLLKTNPDSEEAFRVLVKLVDLDLRQKRYDDVLRRLKSANIPDGGDGETQTAAQNLRAMVRRTATEHHEAFRKKKAHADLLVARAYYQAYLDTFLSKSDPRGEKPEIQMYLAEVERDLGDYKQASDLYRAVVESRDKRYAKEAGALWTASLADQMKRHAPALGAKSHEADEPSALEREFVDAADQMRDSIGETTEAREAALKAAQVLAGYKDTRKDALKRANRMIDDWVTTPQAITAAKLKLQILADQAAADGDLGDLRDAIDELGRNEALMKTDQRLGGKLKAVLAEQRSRLKIKAIAKDEKQQDFGAAAKGYEDFAATAPTREMAEKAYGNAIDAYLKGKDPASAERVTREWLQKHPHSPKALDALKTLATAALIDGDYERSTGLFEQAGAEGDAPSLETAGRIAAGIGLAQRAEHDWASHLDRFRGARERWEVALLLARSEEGQRLDAAASKAYRFCMAGPAVYAAECGARLGDLYRRTADLDQARALYRKVGSMKAASPYVGYARFQLAVALEKTARFEPFQMPESALKKALNQRLQFLEPLSHSYQQAIAAGGPWAVAAVDALAAWASRFADDLDTFAAHGASPAAAKEIRQVAASLRRKAVSTWSEGYAKGAGAEALSPALPEIADHLADAGAAKPGRAQGFRGQLRLAGVAADGGDDGHSGAIEKVRVKLRVSPQDAGAWVDYGNLLWGEQKPGLARIAYDRASALSSRMPSALNDRAVVLLSDNSGPDAGEDDWYTAAEADHLLQQALKQDDFFQAAKINRAALLGYYRVFGAANKLWAQVLTQAKTPLDKREALDGRAVAAQGLGDGASAERDFAAATEAGASSSRFVAIYHEAARNSAQGTQGASRCLSQLGDLDVTSLQGFEKGAVERLREACSKWKNAM